MEPDGTKIVFHLCPNCQVKTNNDIYVFDISTDSVTQLTEHSGSDTNPAWSPDGSRIVFVSGWDYSDADTMRWRKDIYMMNADGTSLHRLTETGNATKPVWNPKSDKIAYEWNIQGNEVFIYSIDTRQITKIETGLKYSSNPLWNKEGTRLLIFGTQQGYSEPQMRLINIENGVTEILHKVTLPSKLEGTGFDWYIDS